MIFGSEQKRVNVCLQAEPRIRNPDGKGLSRVGKAMRKSLIILSCMLSAGIASAAERVVAFKTNTLEAIACSVQLPETWTVYDRTVQANPSWVITPDNLDKVHYQTGVRIDIRSNPKINCGLAASKWVEARIADKSSSLPVLSVETGSTNDYFRVSRLMTREVYSPGRTEYVTYRRIYTWFWNDEHDIVICMVAQTPEKSWNSMSNVVQRVEKLDFNIPEWKKRLAKTEE